MASKDGSHMGGNPGKRLERVEKVHSSGLKGWLQFACCLGFNIVLLCSVLGWHSWDFVNQTQGFSLQQAASWVVTRGDRGQSQKEEGKKEVVVASLILTSLLQMWHLSPAVAFHTIVAARSSSSSNFFTVWRTSLPPSANSRCQKKPCGDFLRCQALVSWCPFLPDP